MPEVPKVIHAQDNKKRTVLYLTATAYGPYIVEYYKCSEMSPTNFYSSG